MLRTFDYERIPIVEVVNEILLDSVKEMLVIFTLNLMIIFSKLELGLMVN